MLLIGESGKLDEIGKLIKNNPELGYKVIDKINTFSLKTIKEIKTKKGIKNIAINVSVEKDAVSEIRSAINDILSSGCDESTKVMALKTFKASTRINNVSISGANINMGADN